VFGAHGEVVLDSVQSFNLILANSQMMRGVDSSGIYWYKGFFQFQKFDLVIQTIITYFLTFNGFFCFFGIVFNMNVKCEFFMR